MRHTTPQQKNLEVAGQMTLLSTRYAALNYLLPDDPSALLKEPHVYQCLGKSSDASADGPGTTGSSAVASGEEIQNSLCKTLEKRTHIFGACRPVREWSLLQLLYSKSRLSISDQILKPLGDATRKDL